MAVPCKGWPPRPRPRLSRVGHIRRATPPTSATTRHKERAVGTITTKDGTEIYYKDWGTGRPVVFSHGWPLSADAWEDQMFYLARRGFRCIAHDRRGHGRSSQPWHGNDMDTYADDLAALVEALDLQGRGPRRPLHRRRRGRPLHRPARHRARRQGRADRRHPAADAQDPGQPRRHADRGVRQAARRRRHRPLAVLEGPQPAVLRLQPARRQDLGGRARVVLAAEHDGRLPGVLLLHQGLLRDRPHRGPEAVRRADADPARRRRPDRPDPGVRPCCRPRS